MILLDTHVVSEAMKPLPNSMVLNSLNCGLVLPQCLKASEN